MKRIRGEYLVDRNGNPKAVVIDLKEYRRILGLLVDARDRDYIRQHRNEKLIPMLEVHRNLKKARLV